MAWAPEDKIVKGCVAFAIWWLLTIFPALPLLPVGRTAGSLLGAVLMVLFGVLSSDAAFASIDLSILTLLFATMVISVYLERARAFHYLARAVTWRTRGARDLLVRVCVLAAVSSALFTNDSTCVVLTGFVLKLCREKALDPKPFLIALASSANIGSAATPIGNPQNLVIAVQGRLGFRQFVGGVLPAVMVGAAANVVGLLLAYGGSLESRCDSLEMAKLDAKEDEGALLPSASASVSMERPALERRESRTASWGARVAKESGVWKVALFVALVAAWVVGATLHTFEAGVGLPWTAVTAAVILTLVDFTDATDTLDKVSYSILVFFSGMFITVEGFNSTGAPTQFWLAVEPYSRIDTTGGMVILTMVVILLSNLASNVPTVLLLGPRVAASAIATSGASPTKAWLMLAWVSTVAGNLTLVGSAANIIVCEKAKTNPFVSYNLTFWTHLKYGFVSTLIIIFIGLPFINLF